MQDEKHSWMAVMASQQVNVLIPLNYTLKDAQLRWEILLCVFYHNLKDWEQKEVGEVHHSFEIDMQSF